MRMTPPVGSTRASDGVGQPHCDRMLPNPALAADVRTREEEP